jgi:NAD(P)-dependent dehydrogenase (short-subunit alcohol dehydrogenase family)
MALNAKRLEGRVALVTGASSGLGRRFAQVLAREGAKVILLARRQDRLEEVLASITSLGGAGMAAPCDVTREEQVIAAFDLAQERFGVVVLSRRALRSAKGAESSISPRSGPVRRSPACRPIAPRRRRLSCSREASHGNGPATE